MILDGKKIKNEILNEVRDEVNKLLVKPKLVVIQIGNDESSNIYIKQKENMCNYVGYEFEHIKLDKVNDDEIVDLICNLNSDDSVTGIMVQLPLPSGYDRDRIVNAISPLKDVDGLTDTNILCLYHNNDCLSSCTALGVIELLKRYNISVANKNVVLVGRSNLVGKPLNMMLMNSNATVTVCHSKTENLSEFTKNADILIVAVGIAKLITEDMVSKDSIIIDVGINSIENGICGDVDFVNVKDKVKYITPVPGGVGPMTVAMLARNLLKAYDIQKIK